MMAREWWPAIHVDDLWEGEMTAVTVDNQRVLLVNIAGTVRAYSNACPHQASPLDEGVLEGDRLTCARHLWEFNACTGSGINPAIAHLKGYGCETRADGVIYVGLEP
jgi:toluene monooxygenase system ferredoxin subunit